MRWTERQRAMLREMGVQLWCREPALVEDGMRPHPDPLPQAGEGPNRGRRLLPHVRERAGARARTGAPTEAFATAAAVQASDWLVVGEPLAPADKLQEQLLDNLLRAIGASRSSSSRASRAAFVALTERAGASPAGPGVDDDALIDAAISAAAPRCVIALGRAAAATLLGRDEPLGAWRGRSHRRGDVPVVVTFSLAFLLRHPAEKAKAWLDLCLAVSASEATSA